MKFSRCEPKRHKSFSMITTVMKIKARLSVRFKREEMSMKPRDVEARFDDFLSRVAVEAREIQELEQQLTEGQILTNELLQKDLEGIFAGLQEYLRGLRLGASVPQAENESVHRHLECAQRHCRQLLDTANARDQKMALQQEALAALRAESQVLKRQKAELEVELKELREELNQQLKLGQQSRPSVAQNQKQMARMQVHPDQKHIAQLEDSLTQYQKHIAQLQEQSSKDRNHIVQLEDHVTRYRMRIAQLEDQATRCHNLDSRGKGGHVKKRASAGEAADCLPVERVQLENSDTPTKRSVLHLCDEVRCVERTLQKRRAELREADRRLMHAHATFHSNQAASQHSATSLKQMALRLRVLRDEEAELRKRTRAEHQRLSVVKAELQDREAESRELCTTVSMATHKLAALMCACQEASARLDQILHQTESVRAELHGMEAEHRRLKRGVLPDG